MRKLLLHLGTDLLTIAVLVFLSWAVTISWPRHPERAIFAAIAGLLITVTFLCISWGRRKP